MADVVDLEYMKGFLGLLDIDTFDEDIEFLIPVYTSQVTQNIDVENLSAFGLNEVKMTIGAGIGCHLQKTRQQFRANMKMYKVGNVERKFFGGVKDEEGQNWCKNYDYALAFVEGSYADGTYSGSVKRQGLTDEYSRPY